MGKLIILSSADISRITEKEEISYVPDSDGYWPVILGALGVPTRGGVIYHLPGGPEGIIKASEDLKMKVSSSTLYASYGHPQRKPEYTDSQWISANLRVSEETQCAHISEVSFDIGRYGPGTALVWGKIKPFGPYGKYVEEGLKNKKMSLSWSIRCLATDKVVNGITHRIINNVITWDYTGNNPGIKVANVMDSKKELKNAIDKKVISLEEHSTRIDMSNIKEVNNIISELEKTVRNTNISTEENSNIKDAIKLFSDNRIESKMFGSW